jgi:hypothetical protein
MMTFDLKTAFYAFNLVANWAYSRWSDIYPVLLAKIEETEAEFVSDLMAIDAKALSLYNNVGAADAIELVTEFGCDAGDKLVSDWNVFFGQLFVRFRDGYDIQQDLSDPGCGCSVASKGYPSETYQRIVDETGDQYLDLNPENSLKTIEKLDEGLKPVSKLGLKSFQ